MVEVVKDRVGQRIKERKQDEKIERLLKQGLSPEEVVQRVPLRVLFSYFARQEARQTRQKKRLLKTGRPTELFEASTCLRNSCVFYAKTNFREKDLTAP